MEWALSIITEHAAIAHWVLFGSLILAGLNLPVSEDFVLVIGGVLAGTADSVAPWHMFLFIFAGAYASDWMVYWIGRLLGPRLFRLSWFRKTVKQSRLEKIEAFYNKYGARTLLIGRFIPFGVRNCLFTTAGMARMPLVKFGIADFIACFASNSLLFWTAYVCGCNYEKLLGILELFDYIAFLLFVVAVIGFFWYKRARRAERL